MSVILSCVCFVLFLSATTSGSYWLIIIGDISELDISGISRTGSWYLAAWSCTHRRRSGSHWGPLLECIDQPPSYHVYLGCPTMLVFLPGVVGWFLTFQPAVRGRHSMPVIGHNINEVLATHSPHCPRTWPSYAL